MVLLFNSKVFKILMKTNIVMGLMDNQNNGKSKEPPSVTIQVNIHHPWQASSFLNVNLLGCGFLIILTINIVIELSLTNIPTNKCVYIPNTYFFLNLLYSLSSLKNQHALVGFRERPAQNRKGPLSTSFQNTYQVN